MAADTFFSRFYRFIEVGMFPGRTKVENTICRAYLNGKMDLSRQALVADLIAYFNKATHKMALSQLKEVISNEHSFLQVKNY